MPTERFFFNSVRGKLKIDGIPEVPTLLIDVATTVHENLDRQVWEFKAAVESCDLVQSVRKLYQLQKELIEGVIKLGLGGLCFTQLYDDVHRANLSKQCNSMQEVKETMEWYRKREFPSQCESYSEASPTPGKFVVRRQGDHKMLKNVHWDPPVVREYLARFGADVGASSGKVLPIVPGVDHFGCEQAREFLVLTGQYDLALLQEEEMKRVLARIRFIQEEVAELKRNGIEKHDLEETADALVDVQYYLAGFMQFMGIQDSFPKIFEALLADEALPDAAISEMLGVGHDDETQSPDSSLNESLSSLEDSSED